MDTLTVIVAAVTGVLLLLPRLVGSFRKRKDAASDCGTGCGGCTLHARCGERIRHKGGAA